MIKCEVVFDGDLIYHKDRLIFMTQGVDGDYWEVEGVAETFITQEQAIKYCMDN